MCSKPACRGVPPLTCTSTSWSTCRTSWYRRSFISMSSKTKRRNRRPRRGLGEGIEEMNRREFLAMPLVLAGTGFLPRLTDAGTAEPIRLAHLGAHEGRFTTGALTLVSGYSEEGHHFAGQAVAELISRHVSGAKALLTVVATPAGALRLLQAGRTDTPYGQFTVDLALVDGDELGAALRGVDAFQLQDPGELRLLAVLPAQVLHIVTLHGSPIAS